MTEGVSPVIKNTSGPAEMALAQHLTDIGAKMYGAYWSPYCHQQKELFGKEAAQVIPYIECGDDFQTAFCQSILEPRGFPTWEIHGTFLAGLQSLETLANESGYEGNTHFQKAITP